MPDLLAKKGFRVPDLFVAKGFRVPDLFMTKDFRVPDYSPTKGFRVPDLFAAKGFREPDLFLTNGFRVPDLFVTKGFRVPDLFTGKKALGRAREPANFLAAPAPDFFFKQLRLLIFFPSGSGSCFFFWWLQLPGAKKRLWLLTIGFFGLLTTSNDFFFQPTPGPDFFPKQLRLWLLYFFFEWLRPWFQSAKNPAPVLTIS